MRFRLLLSMRRDDACQRAGHRIFRNRQPQPAAFVLRKFAATARKRMRIEGGGYRRDHLRALAQRVEVADREVRIMGSKSDLLRTRAAISGAKSATGGFRSSVLNWRKGCPVNPVDFAYVYEGRTAKATVSTTGRIGRGRRCQSLMRSLSPTFSTILCNAGSCSSSTTSRKPRLAGGTPAAQPPVRGSRMKSVM